MGEYTNFSHLQSGELSMLRRGFFNPDFEFTDGETTYGKVISNGGKKPVLETATQSWVLERGAAPLKKTMLINTREGVNIGMLNSNDMLLRLNNGFEATLALTGGGRYSIITGGWKNAQQGDLVTFKQSLTSYKKPYAITFDSRLLKSINEMPLLILLGTFIAFLKQTHSFRY